MVPLAQDLGLRVFRTDEWPENVSGAILRNTERWQSDSGYVVFVNGKHHVNRRRFTIAHEIGHFVLHKDRIGDGITDDALFRSGQSNQIETEANQFAARILMPNDLLLPKWASPLSTIQSLAEEFEVSPVAMSIRLGVPYL
jgi:Zn-dependent peptidase ImmA (M78 family)